MAVRGVCRWVAVLLHLAVCFNSWPPHLASKPKRHTYGVLFLRGTFVVGFKNKRGLTTFSAFLRHSHIEGGPLMFFLGTHSLRNLFLTLTPICKHSNVQF